MVMTALLLAKKQATCSIFNVGWEALIKLGGC